jgi:DedD protein
MNSLRDKDLDAHEESHSEAEHEISLGTATILGIFFALALVCAGFFGFGYSLGRKSAPAPVVAAAPPAAESGTLFSAFKPAAGSPASHPNSQAADPQPDAPPPAPVAPSAPTIPPAAARNGATPADAIIVGDKLGGEKSLAARPATPQPAPANLQPATTPTGAFMVQIAAVSTQDIADIEVTALKKYGFDVVVRHEPQDQLLHIQVGPYATRKDAEAMRQTILAHGFNAIVK